MKTMMKSGGAMKKAQVGTKLKPGQVTAKRAYAISDSLKKESEKPLNMTTKESLKTSLRNKQMNRQKSQRINQRADNAMEKAGGERRFAKDDRMLNYKSGGKVKAKSGGVLSGAKMKKAMMGASMDSPMMESPMMKKGGKVKKAAMKMGGAMKKCKYGCK